MANLRDKKPNIGEEPKNKTHRFPKKAKNKRDSRAKGGDRSE